MNIYRFATQQLFSQQLVQDPMRIFMREYTRKAEIKRWGWKPKYHCEGLLPRVKNDKLPLKSVPYEPKPDPWRPKQALFGQNDYIDILGDGSIKPTDLLTDMPHWLRGFRGNEMQMLIRKKKAKSHWKWMRPKKWHEMEERIKYLYGKLNFKKRQPQADYPWGKKRGHY